MARLDVHERKIEATIAYLGPDLAGRSTNLLRLGVDAAVARDGATEGRPIAWRPIGLARFDDCDIAVRVVAPRGSLDDDAVIRAVQDADGVVVVLDADPDARERNREWLDPARMLLGPRDGAPRSVVVQINKSDLTGADAARDLVGALDLGAWPHVVASAVRGEGVVETIRCVLENVLADLEGGSVAPPPPGVVRADAHPLLTALRQVLDASIDARIGAIEGRIIERLGARTEALAADERERLDALEDRLATRFATSTRDALAEVRAEAAEASALAQQLREDVARLETTLATALSALQADAVRRVDLERVERGLRDEVLAASRADREHQAAASTALRRAVEALKTDLRPIDHSSDIRTMTEVLGRLGGRLDEALSVVAPTAAAVRSIPMRMGESQDRTRNVVLKSVQELGQRVDSSIEALQAEGSAAWSRIDTRTAKVEAVLDELLDELKKRKKGWFG